MFDRLWNRGLRRISYINQELKLRVVLRSRVQRILNLDYSSLSNTINTSSGTNYICMTSSCRIFSRMFRSAVTPENFVEAHLSSMCVNTSWCRMLILCFFGCADRIVRTRFHAWFFEKLGCADRNARSRCWQEVVLVSNLACLNTLNFQNTPYWYEVGVVQIERFDFEILPWAG